MTLLENMSKYFENIRKHVKMLYAIVYKQSASLKFFALHKWLV